MNLKDLRTAIFSQTDWAPTQSTEAITRLNGFINRAYNDVCLEAPFLFFESEVKFATQKDAVSAQASDTISVSVLDVTGPVTDDFNPWVFEQDITADTPGYLVWAIDRSWDGRLVEIEVKDGSKTTTYRNQIRAVWKYTPEGGTPRYRFSVVTPWPYEALGTGPFKYRVYTEHYYLPEDVVQVRSMRLFKENRNWPLGIMGQEEAENYSFADSPAVTSHGLPRSVFRRPHFQLPGPSVAPTVALGSVEASPTEVWLGPEPPGKFEYVITYCWGKRDLMFRTPTMGYHLGYADQWKNTQGAFYTESYNLGAKETSENRFREPLWESSPSPISAEVVTTASGEASVGTPSVKITLPNIEYMQGFMTTGAQKNLGAGTSSFLRRNYRESGWWVRIYRRRATADFTNYGNLKTIVGVSDSAGGATITGLNKLDLPTVFFLLAETKIDDVNRGIFYDNGRIIPDYHRRLKVVHGYQAIQLYPYPDERYEVDVRCVRRPPKLVDDEDAPLVDAVAIDLIVHRTLMFLYENMGNPGMAQLAQSRYKENLYTLTKRYGDLRPPAVPVLRRFGRARAGWDQRGTMRRWWTVKTP